MQKFNDQIQWYKNKIDLLNSQYQDLEIQHQKQLFEQKILIISEQENIWKIRKKALKAKF